MLFSKILEKIIEICIIENFSKFEITKANINIILYTRNQSVAKATDYITTVLPNRNIGLKLVPKSKKKTHKMRKC